MQVFSYFELNVTFKNCSLQKLGSILVISVSTSDSSVLLNIPPKRLWTLSVKILDPRTSGLLLSSYRNR